MPTDPKELTKLLDEAANLITFPVVHEKNALKQKVVKEGSRQDQSYSHNMLDAANLGKQYREAGAYIKKNNLKLEDVRNTYIERNGPKHTEATDIVIGKLRNQLTPKKP